MAEPTSKVPSNFWLQRILLTKFNLVFRRGINTSCYMYQSPSFHQRRLWASRLLAHFFLNEPDLLIVSIDESSFRSDRLPKSAWAQEVYLGKRRLRVQQSHNEVVREKGKARFKRYLKQEASLDLQREVLRQMQKGKDGRHDESPGLRESRLANSPAEG